MVSFVFDSGPYDSKDVALDKFRNDFVSWLRAQALTLKLKANAAKPVGEASKYLHTSMEFARAATFWESVDIVVSKPLNPTRYMK